MAKTKKKTTKKSVKSVKKKTAKKKTAAKKTTKKSSGSLKVYKPKVAVGKKVPDFSIPQTGDETFKLSAFKGQKVVIYFYPKDSTPGCTVEGHDFTKLQNKFRSKGAEVFGVSRDNMRSHERFKEKQGYTIDLLSDEDEKMCAIFGVIKLKNMYGKKVRGIERSTFVIDENGKLAQEWRGVKVPGHAQEVLKSL